jgi:FtsP/CotA-like multicopper oxidase with cupredoxin domain
VLEPRLTIRPGETQRWRIVSGAAHRALELAIERRDSGERLLMHQIAQDGINFPVSRARETILLAPGNRVEVLIQGGPRGVYQLKSLPHDQGHPGGPRPEVLLATLVSTGRTVPDPTAFPLTLIPTQMPDISRNPIANTRTVTWSREIMTAPLVFRIDGRVFDPERSDQTITVGTTELWTLVNDDVFQHPFHIHVNPFQVVALNGQVYPEPDVLRLENGRRSAGK